MKGSGAAAVLSFLVQGCSSPAVAPAPPTLAREPVSQPAPPPSAPAPIACAPAPSASSSAPATTEAPVEPLGLPYFPEPMVRQEPAAGGQRGARTAVVLFAAPGAADSPDVGLQEAVPPRFLPVACVLRGKLTGGLRCAEAMPQRARVRVSSQRPDVLVDVERSRKPYQNEDTKYPAPFEPSCCFYNGCRDQTIPYRPLASAPATFTRRALFAVWPPDADVSFEAVEPGLSQPLDADAKRALDVAAGGDVTLMHSFAALDVRGASIARGGRRDLELFLFGPSGWHPVQRSPGRRWMVVAATDLDGDAKPELYVINKPQNDYGLTVLEVGTDAPLHEFNCGNI